MLNHILAASLLALALTSGASAAAPNCGFDAPIPWLPWLMTFPYINDCYRFGTICIPIWEEDCAGVVHEIRTPEGGYAYTWTWNRESLSEARREGLRYCRSRKRGGCSELMVVRHAAAGYRPRGGRATWAQATDKQTAMDIAKSRCESGGKRPCTLVGAFENRRNWVPRWFGSVPALRRGG